MTNPLAASIDRATERLGYNADFRQRFVDAILAEIEAEFGPVKVEREVHPVFDRKAHDAAFACIPRSCKHWDYVPKTRFVSDWRAEDEQ